MNINEIEKQLVCLNHAINWVNTFLVGEKKDASYARLVKQRRYLKKIKSSLKNNPAAAIYGESQKGKSYLVSSLLSNNGEPFYVSDSNGFKYDFKLEINPIGQNKESTSLVTRFTPNLKIQNEEFPVKVELMKVSDIILVVSGTYFNDLNNQKQLSTQSINQQIYEIIQNSHAGSNSIQHLLEEDDIGYIEEYFKNYFSSDAANILTSDFFEIVSKNIESCSIHIWSDIFSILWNNNSYMVELFKRLLFKLQEVDFVNSLYIPYRAVLRKHGTLLDVERLAEFNNQKQGSEKEYESDTQIFYTNEKGRVTIKTFKKSSLCALASELIFKLPEELKDTKPFLETTDLLDFPGSRARLENNESDLNDEIIPDMLLRGKVGFLFNNYSYNDRINSLILCHDNQLTSQRYIPSLLNDWIANTIGKTQEEREQFISYSQIPPLFIIATKFNVDLQIIQADNSNSSDTLVHRWNQRFSRVLKEELINTDIYKWFENWSVSNKCFNNIYLLRDFYYSSESQSQLYRGYNENGYEVEEIIHPQYRTFRNDLKNSFLNHDFVKRHFSGPEKSWNEAATINKDGTELIISNLSIVSSNINSARQKKYNLILASLSNELINELLKHYHTGDADDFLVKAKENAGRLQAKLDILFGRNPYFFPEMINNFMISEARIYNHIRENISNLDAKFEIKFNEYTTIRMNVSGLSSEKSFEENLSVLATAYNFKDNKACEEYFKSEKMDLKELFFGHNNQLKMLSTQLAESLKLFWLDECRAKNAQSEIEKLSESEVDEILNVFSKLYDILKITNKIAKQFETYVDRYDQVDMVQEMIADMAAEIINTFVNSVGFAFYSNEDKEDFYQANERNKLGLDLDFEENTEVPISKNDVGTLFEKIDSLPKLFETNPNDKKVLDFLPGFANFRKWNSLLKFGFIAVCNIPNYDVEANEALSEIIKQSKSIKFVD